MAAISALAEVCPPLFVGMLLCHMEREAGQSLSERKDNIL